MHKLLKSQTLQKCTAVLAVLLLPAVLLAAQGHKPAARATSGATSAGASRPASASSSSSAATSSSSAATAPASQPIASSSPTTATAPVATSGPTSRPSSLTAAAVEARLSQVQADLAARNVQDPLRGQVLELYHQALDQVKLADESSAKAQAFAKAVADAPGQLAAAEADLQNHLSATSQPLPSVPPDATAAQLEQGLAQAEADARRASRDIADIDQETKYRGDRRSADIAKQTDALRSMLQDVQKQAAAPGADEAPELQAARRMLWQAQEQAIRRQMATLRAERDSYDDPERARLLKVSHDLAVQKQNEARDLVTFWKDRLSQKRNEEAAQAAKAAEAAQAAAAAAPEVLKTLAAQNAQLAQRRAGPDGLLAKLASVTAELDETTAELRRVNEDFKNVSQRVNAAGTTNTIGLLLRKQRASLGDVGMLARKRKAHQGEIDEARVAMFDLDDERAAALNIDAAVGRVLAELPPSTTSSQRQQIADSARAMLKARVKFIDELQGDYTNYVGKLSDLDSRQTALIRDVRKFQEYIDQRVLWIPSASVLRPGDLPKAADALLWLTRPDSWKALAAAAWGDLKSSVMSAIGATLVVMALVALRRRIRRRLNAISSIVLANNSESLRLTFEALVLTLARAAAVPSALALVGRRLARPVDAPELGRSVGAGLLAASLVYLTLEVLVQTLGKRGLAEVHFRWPVDSLAPVRAWFYRLMPIALPLVFIVAAMEWQGAEVRKDSLGRLAFIVLMLVLCVFNQRMVQPAGQIMRAALMRTAGGWLERMRHLWYAAAVGIPLVLAIAAAMGFYYTSLQVAYRIFATSWLLLAMVILNAASLRWLSIAWRKLALLRARRRQFLPQKAASQGTPDSTASSQPSGPAAASQDAAHRAKDNEINLTAVGAQTRQILRYGMAVLLVIGTWMIWADMLPALGVLRDVSMWTHTGPITRIVPSPEGTTTSVVEGPVPTTLADLLIAAGVAVLTLVASKNFPGLMEITVLQRLSWEPGGRYAFVTILRYVIVVAGAVITLGLLGVSWSSVQWLIAAMTVGLGFGLQEIFANFVSGIILLFERPMRVGDIVTVGDMSGTVSRIRIRATTITDFDRKELVIPNKTFITGQLVNWTLTDSVLRLVVPIAAPYGTDAERVRDLLLKVARECPTVLPSPPVQCDFMQFGESSLDFELRVFVDLAKMGQCRNDLQAAIQRAFAAEGIEMPFPQRDVHVRTASPAKSPSGSTEAQA